VVLNTWSFFALFVRTFLPRFRLKCFDSKNVVFLLFLCLRWHAMTFGDLTNLHNTKQQKKGLQNSFLSELWFIFFDIIIQKFTLDCKLDCTPAKTNFSS
jgi:hypothetical protein